MRVRGFRAVARRHPRAVDAAVALGAAAACGIILTGRTGATVGPAAALDWVSVVVLAVPLVWRQRAPVLVFASVVALLVTAHALGAQSPAALLVPLIALHAVARRRPARYVWPAAVVTILSGFDLRLDDSRQWGALVAVSAITVATVMVGLNQRTREAYLSELESRADRLEREADQQARLAVAEERARIAREMHDVIAHHLAVMVALADGAAATSPKAPERAAGVMTQVSATGRQALGEMRRLLGLLRSDAGGRTPQPGLGDLDALVDRIRAAGVRVAVTREGLPGPWGPGAGLVVYRIVQEALTNTLKHAGPGASAEVRLRYRHDGVDLEVVDDGAGRTARERDGDRHGLTGMQQRATAYGGRAEAGPRRGPGWRVRAHLPLGTDGPPDVRPLPDADRAELGA
jgi:signal transduction histidine kinase